MIAGGVSAVATPQVLDTIRAQYGLNEPIVVQYLIYLGHLASGDFGASYQLNAPVIGVITAGSVYFEVKGEAPRVLNPGDAFFEPANAHVPHFDAQEKGATFIAHYLLGEDEHELLKMID